MSNRIWSILSWNVRGMNSQAKLDHIRNKIAESGAAIVCLQETKRDSFDQQYISQFCPRHLNKFAFFRSGGASGGLLIVWNGNIFSGDVVLDNAFSITVKFRSSVSGAIFHLTNIYGPAAPVEKASFVNWLYNFDISAFEDWIMLGDFNFIRSPTDRNKPGGCVNSMMLFNDLIQHLDLIDIPFEGRQYTWSNIQDNPLLEELDWVFTSLSWSVSYPATSVKPLSRPTSDHVPYVVRMDSHIPKASIFRFENFWVDFPGFFDLV